MVDLSRIPPRLLARAAQMPENSNRGAQAALQRALKGRRDVDPAPKAEAPQNATEDVSGTLHVVLPLPPKELSPNARVHWSLRSRLVKAARARATEGARTALHFAGMAPPMWERAYVKMIFYWPDKRRRDASNAAASTKAYEDGIEDAGVIANDEGFSFLPVEMQVDRENPRVEITVTHTP